jgi:hypothetical protein
MTTIKGGQDGGRKKSKDGQTEKDGGSDCGLY